MAKMYVVCSSFQLQQFKSCNLNTQTDGQTDLTENTTFPHVRIVKTKRKEKWNHFTTRYLWLSFLQYDVIFSKQNMRQRRSAKFNDRTVRTDGFQLMLPLMPYSLWMDVFSVFSLWTLKVSRESQKDSKKTRSVFQQLSSFSFLSFLCLF